MSEESKRYVVDEATESEARSLGNVIGTAIGKKLPEEAKAVAPDALSVGDVARLFDATIVELIRKEKTDDKQLLVYSRAGSYVRHAARKLIENIAEDGSLIVDPEQIMKEDIEAKILEDNPPEETMEEIEKMMEEDSKKNDATMRDLGIGSETGEDSEGNDNEGEEGESGDDGSAEVSGSEEGGNPEHNQSLGGTDNE